MTPWHLILVNGRDKRRPTDCKIKTCKRCLNISVNIATDCKICLNVSVNIVLCGVGEN